MKDRIEVKIVDWTKKLTQVTRTTGKINFDLLKTNLFFMQTFPKVTDADRFVINKLLANIGKYSP